MPRIPDDVAAAFEKRIEMLEAQIQDLYNRQTWVVRSPSGQARVVIGNLLPVTGLYAFGIAVWDDETSRWWRVQHEEE